MRNKYPSNFDDYLRENAPKMKREKLRQQVEQVFSLNISQEKFHQYLWRHGIQCKDYNKNQIRNMMNKKPIGYEYVKDDGMILVKIGDNKWKYKQRLIWENHYNEELTDEEYIIFLDQDRTNFNINNLKKVSRRESAILSNQKMFSKNKDVTELGILTAKLMIQVKESDRL